MITFTEAQLLAWITPLLWPFLRALALFTAMPVFGTRTVPMRVRIGLAAFVALAAGLAAIVRGLRVEGSVRGSEAPNRSLELLGS